MKKTNKVILILMATCFILFADSYIFRKTEPYIISTEDLTIEIDVQSVRRLDTGFVKIRAQIAVKNLTEKTVLFDLKDLDINTAENYTNRESKIYIDSIGTVLIEPFEINALNTYVKNVYWIVDDYYYSNDLQGSLSFDYKTRTFR